MSTTKSIKIQKNKILTYSVNKPGFKTIYGTELINQNDTINIEMINVSDTDPDKPYKLGDRLFGISSFVDYFTPSGSYDLHSLKYINATQTTGTSLTRINVVKNTWLSKVETSLGIETPKGTSKNFIFTYNGSTWDITGDLTLSGQDKDDYGISFTGTPTNGDVITVVETQYNRFAFFVLDSDYRATTTWWTSSSSYNHLDFLVRYTITNVLSAGESATYYNDYISENYNLSTFPCFNSAKNLGNFILPNGIKINALIPNVKETVSIYNNRVRLDDADPTIITSGQACNLTNWNFMNGGQAATHNSVMTCIENNGNYSFRQSDGNYNNGIETLNKAKYNNGNGSGFVPIFEVPVM